MFLKKCYLDKSPIHGIGLFAGEDIKMGQNIWLPSHQLTFHFNDSELKTLPSQEIRIVKHYGYLHKKTNIWHFCSEDSRYINHSENPNTYLTPENTDGFMAKKDIKKDEELTQDYRDFEELRDF
ncbi:MAG: uncharacterized protein QG566_168 [Patescibacteria group bacterium]|jgi:SET domain-containing protein|nr:uncharacterized protein [Patescibacteria group bacterium]